MNKNISRLNAAESAPSEMEPGMEDSSQMGRCICQHCGLYRWYPPMMLMTTALAAVFCWMYITKPVFLAPPEDQFMDARPAIQERRPVHEDEPAPHTAGGGNLDPATGRLPGDPEMADEVSPAAEIPGEGLKPLIVNRRGPSLFRSIPPDEMPERKGIAGEVPPGVAEGGGSGQDENPVSEGDNMSPVVGGKGGQNSSSEEFRVHASFMAEFPSVEQKGGSRPDLKP